MLRVQSLERDTVCAAGSLRLPRKPNTVEGNDPFALWMAPGDWLVYSRTHSASDLASELRAEIHAQSLLTTDVSGGRCVLELCGARTLDVLMRDCPLDLEGGAIPAEQCAQTLFAHTTVIIHRPSSALTHWILFVERSVSQHVWEWLIDTAAP